MHGLINTTIQRFVTDTYGEETWLQVSIAAELGFTSFEAMLIYEEELTLRVLAAVCETLVRSRDEVLEDIGTYLVSHPNAEVVRRLLRFGGENFTEFLHSLDDLPDRARLAVADLDLPSLELREHAVDQFSLTVRAKIDGFGHVMIGMLRSLADDYGALVLLEHKGGRRGSEVVDITLIETGFAEGRSFELGAGESLAGGQSRQAGGWRAPGGRAGWLRPALKMACAGLDTRPDARLAGLLWPGPDWAGPDRAGPEQAVSDRAAAEQAAVFGAAAMRTRAIAAVAARARP